MTSYLWHFSALIIAAGIAMPTGLLPTAPIGSGAWWLQKLIIMAMASIVLVVFLVTIGRKERSSLLSNDSNITFRKHDFLVSITLAITLAAGFEIWTSAEGGNRTLLLVGSGLVLGVRVALAVLGNRRIAS